VVHRDIKPANILLGKDGSVVVTDFGVAKALGREKLTRTRGVVGTYEYMSPEQVQGEEVTAASDLYSLGITLYKMLTGVVPFPQTSETGLECMNAHVAGVATSVSEYREGIPTQLGETVVRYLGKEPDRRLSAHVGADASAPRSAKSARSPRGIESSMASPVPAQELLRPGVVGAAEHSPASPPSPNVEAVPTFLGMRALVWGIMALLLILLVGGGVVYVRGSSGELLWARSCAHAWSIFEDEMSGREEGFSPSSKGREGQIESCIEDHRKLGGEQADNLSKCVLQQSIWPGVSDCFDLAWREKSDSPLDSQSEEKK